MTAPAAYYCQAGSTQSVCTACPACSSSNNSKCQADLGCRFPCCLDQAGISCYDPNAVSVPGVQTQTTNINRLQCCPSSGLFDTNSMQYNSGGSTCSCDVSQVCPAFPPPTQLFSPVLSPVLGSPESPSSSPSSPGLLSPNPPPVVMTVTTAAQVSVVTATQKLVEYTVATFDTTAKDSFLTTLSENINQLSGLVLVSIPDGGITPGSVNVQTSVVFLNGDPNGVEAYKSAMRSSSSSVFGAYAAVVDPNTISQGNTTNPHSGVSSGADQLVMGSATLLATMLTTAVLLAW